MSTKDLRSRYEDVAIRGLERTVPRDAPHYAANVEFVKQRFAEGLELVGYFASKYGERPLRILDLGAGAGGVAIALSSEPQYRVTAVDVVMNSDLVELTLVHGAQCYVHRVPEYAVATDATTAHRPTSF